MTAEKKQVMKITRQAGKCGAAAVLFILAASPELKALTVSFDNQNTAVSGSNIWVMFGGANNATLSGSLTYSGTPQPLTFGTTYRLADIASQRVELASGDSSKIFILYSTSGTEFNGSAGNPSYNFGQNTPSVNARWDKVEFTQFTATTPASGFNMSAADFFSIPLQIETLKSGTRAGFSGWHPRTPTATVFQNLGSLIASGSSQPYAIVQSTSTTSTAAPGYSIPVTITGTTLNVLRIINPQQVPLTVVGTNNPLPNPYVSFTPYITYTATTGNTTTLRGTYGGVNTGTNATPGPIFTLPADAYVTQDYIFSSTITPAGDLIISGSGVANINTGTKTPVGAQTIRVKAADLAQGIYTAAPPYTVDSFKGGVQRGSNSVYDQVISDLLAGFNLGLVGSTVIDPRLSGTAPLNNIPAGTELGQENSAAWFSTGPSYGLNPMLSAAQAFSTAQPKRTFYNEYAEYVSGISDAYSFPYTDKTAAPLLTTTPGVADTAVITILPDSATVPGLLSANIPSGGAKFRYLNPAVLTIKVQNQPKSMPLSAVNLYLKVQGVPLNELTVRVTPPQGNMFYAHNATGGNTTPLVLSGVPVGSDKLVNPNGVWSLVVKDIKSGNNQGAVVSWGVQFPPK